MNKLTHSLFVFPLFVILITEVSTSYAGPYDVDPFGWSQQSNARGIESACKSYINEYNTLVDIHNSTNNQEKRAAFKIRLREIEAEQRRLGCR